MSCKKKRKRTHADSFASGCLGVCMRVSVGVCWSAGVSVSLSTCVDGCVYWTLHPCHGVNVRRKRFCPEDWCLAVSFGIVNCSFYFTLSLSHHQVVCEMWGLTAAPFLWMASSPRRGYRWSRCRASPAAAPQMPAGGTTAPLRWSAWTSGDTTSAGAVNIQNIYIYIYNPEC